MKLYRVENLAQGRGLWFDLDQKLGTTFGLLSAKEVPMPFDANIANGRWKSAANSLEQLNFWFKPEDLLLLSTQNYQLTEIEVVEFKVNKTEWYEHPLFQEQHVISRKKL